MRFSTFNCKNIKSSIGELRKLCSVNDVILLQETWLASDELAILHNVHEDFYGKGTSAIDVTTGTVTGRPHGGLAILWRKSMTGVKIIDMCDPRLMCIEISSDSQCLALLNVYMPVDHSQNVDDFMYYLAKIEDFLRNHSSPYIAVCGDFNANLLHNSHSPFGQQLMKFCHDNNLLVADQRLCPASSFTFYSEAHGSVSWLDHVITNVNLMGLISNAFINYDYVTSDHFPLNIELDMSITKAETKQTALHSNSGSARIRWDNLNEHELAKYKTATDVTLGKVKLSHSLLLCDNVHCNDVQHMQQIDSMYKGITEALYDAGLELVEHFSTKRNYEIPGWNDLCKQAHSEAREAFLIWVSNGRPRSGPLFSLMSKTRAHFKLSKAV